MEISQFKDKSSKHSKPSQDCTCDLCSKVMSRRGLFNHMRLAHGLSNDDARETTRRILQNTPYAYTGVKRLLTISVDESGIYKVKSGIKNVEELFNTLKVIEETLKVEIQYEDENGFTYYRSIGFKK
jgi:hypothetical protein